MSSKKKIFALLLAAAIVALNLGIFCYRVPVAGEFQLIVELKVDHEEEIQIYYGENTEFQEVNSEKILYSESGEYQELEFHIPSTASVVRFDFGTEPGEFEIRSVYLQYADTVSQIAPVPFQNQSVLPTLSTEYGIPIPDILRIPNTKSFRC